MSIPCRWTPRRLAPSPAAAPAPERPRQTSARHTFRQRPLRASLGFLFRLVCALLILLDELARPVYRPLVARIAALRVVHAFERWVAARSVWTILALLVIPYATVEPLKFVGLIWIAGGWEKARRGAARVRLSAQLRIDRTHFSPPAGPS
ncbi:hypothetical protein ACFSKM_25050 [Ancylobacter dichloromethanicus]